MYDAIVIGAGPAGYVSAIKMAHLGLKVLAVEKEHAGGTCTNKGCIPTKALLVAAELYNEIQNKGPRIGITASEITYSFDKIKKHMQRAITTSRKGVEYLFKKNGIEYVKGQAVVEKPGVVRVGENTFEAKNVLIATGSVPTLFPPFNEVEGVWTSDDVFKMETLPGSILIVGGGVIGVEMASFFSMLGVRTYIVEIMDHILPAEDSDVADVLRKALKGIGVVIYESSKVKAVDRKGEGFVVAIETPKETLDIEVDKVLVSVGRRPLIGDDIKSLGVNIERGIVTDENLRTSVEGIYAAGDVRAKIMLAHVGFHEGIVAAYNIKGEEKKVDLSVVPAVIYTAPEVASVGLKEKDMDKEKHRAAKFPISANGRAAAMGEREGFAKVVYDKSSGKVLGTTIVGPFASELIMEATVAVKHGLTVEELAWTIHPHPTISESLLGAFEEAEGKAIHL
ncbi:MAG: dihydrolipoyl dehydrogenase [Thermotogaceae bacterium]|nr:dihydrolipoyl dehydrogenase [Thermotogaceae bacterium]